MTLEDLRNRLGPAWPALDVHVHPLPCFGPYKVGSPAEAARNNPQYRLHLWCITYLIVNNSGGGQIIFRSFERMT